MSRPIYILIIDDDPDDAEFLINAFTARFPDARFRHCRNGMEGLQFLREVGPSPHACPDIAFLDLHMPGKNGYETLVELKGSGTCENLPVLIISTSLLSAESERCRAAGCTDYFTKPVSLQGYDDIVSKSLTYLDKNINTSTSFVPAR